MPPEITRERLNFSQTRKVKWRYLSKKYDRFRRLYICWLDRNNSEPTGQVERAFSAPIDIPDEFMKFPENEPWRVELDLDGYARYLKQKRQEWELNLEQIRANLRAGDPPEKALRIAGNPPQDWRLIVLMSRGDPWCLGFQDKRTPAVIAIIGPEPTAEQLRRERERGPADLRLSPELEELIGEGVQSQFPDEKTKQDDELRIKAQQPLRRDDIDASRRAHLDQILGPTAGQSVDSVTTGDDEEDILTGDLDLDDPALAQLAASDDKLLDLEEEHDAAATGGKKQNPRKNKTAPKE